ncbi:MAG: flagellar assembly protein FliX [Rhodobiaceae bacterium]|nr:flagellar assembly protein FliX [Rhodobiaceae bacterium]
MRIESAHRVTGSAGARRRDAGSGDGFTLSRAAERPAAQATRSAATLSGVEALIMLQEVDDATVRRRRAVKRGHVLLDLLDSLKLDLMAGFENPVMLARLADIARRERDLVNDPRLAEVLEEIELRTAVELAKRGIVAPA